MNILKKICLGVLAFSFLINITVMAESKVITPSEEAAYFEMVASDVVDLYQFDMDEYNLLNRTIRNMINENPEMLDAFLRAMFDSLDDYSEFYSPEEYRAMINHVQNITGGIGVTVSKSGNYVSVVNALEGGSAYDAGIMAGDSIFSVNGEEMFGKPMEYVTSRMKGEIGTNVNVTVLRNGEKIDFTLTRRELKLNSVYATVLTDKLGYIEVTQFGSDTYKEFKEALDEFDTKGVTDIILDLRNNTGGVIDGAVEIAKMLVPEGVIITHKMKFNDLTTVYKSELKEKKYNIITLVNDYTASAAEILASALQESGASALVGNQTYGKAVTQNVLGLYGGRACKVTTGEYFTRDGNSINKVGIIPDHIIDNITVPLSESTVEKFVYNGYGYTKGSTGAGVRGINQRLSLMGYNVEVNDTYSEKTESAVKYFQEIAGLEQTGVCDITTQMFLANEADSKNILIDMQFNKALELLGSDYETYTVKE